MTNAKDVLVVFRALASLASDMKGWAKKPNDDWTETEGKEKKQRFSCGFEICVRDFVSTMHEITERRSGNHDMGGLKSL